MKLEVGDKVLFINEKGGGVFVRNKSSQIAIIELEDGLEIPVYFSEVVKASNNEENKFQKESQSTIEFQEKVFRKEKTNNTRRGSEVQKIVLEKGDEKKSLNRKKKTEMGSSSQEIDLHIENLMGGSRHLSNGEIISIQLNHFQYKLEAAIRNKCTKIVFIHGVGNGVLKFELRKLLDNYSGVEYNDASYAKYGYGATEVHLR